MALSDIIPAYFEQQSINPVTIESMNADELARQQVYENINRKPVTPYLDAFVPAEMVNVSFQYQMLNHIHN
jgi:ParB-like chromosome segregation protein Spo0J